MIVQRLRYIDLLLLRLAVQQDLSREKVMDSDANILHLMTRRFLARLSAAPYG